MLQETLQKLVRVVATNKSGSASIDTSDVGQAKKRRKLTAAQKAWARGGDALDYDSDESDDDYDGGDFFRAAYHLLRGVQRNAPPRVAPAGCDCGHPHRLTAGLHVCRYFGHFECASCHNRWTSAYIAGGARGRSAVVAARRACRTRRNSSTAAPVATASPTTRVAAACASA